MGRKLTPFETELGQRVDEVLHYVWDPIGVATSPEARDEYSGYSLHVLGLLLESAPQEAIAAYLTEVEHKGMGLSERPEHGVRLAALLARWKRVLQEKYERSQ